MHVRFWYAGLYLHFSELCVVNSGRSFVIHSSSQKRAVSNLAVTWKRCHIAQDSFYLFCFLFCNIKHAHDCSSFRPTSVWNKEGEACFYFHFEFVSSPFHTSALKMNLCSKHTRFTDVRTLLGRRLTSHPELHKTRPMSLHYWVAYSEVK